MAKKDNKANANINADVNVKEDRELTQEEKTALEIQQATVKGEEINKKFKLADPQTQYAEQGFTLSRDEEKELPENPSTDLLQRIRAGFIVEVK